MTNRPPRMRSGADRLVSMSLTPDSAVRTYIEQHRAAFLDDLVA